MLKVENLDPRVRTGVVRNSPWLKGNQNELPAKAITRILVKSTLVGQIAATRITHELVMASSTWWAAYREAKAHDHLGLIMGGYEGESLSMASPPTAQKLM